MNDRVSLEVREFNRVREWIAAQSGLDADDEVVIDTADGETSLTGLLAHIVRESRQRLADADACAVQIKALSERKKRHMDAAEKSRARVAEAMLEAGLPKLSPGDFTATAKMTAPKPEVINEDELEPFYTRTVRVPDKEAINGEYKRCQAEGVSFEIPGVSISNGRPSLTVRV